MVNRYPSTLIDELNRLLAPHGQMIDGSVTDDVTNGIAADVSPFHVTRSGPRMHGAFGMLLHVGPRIRAEIETSHNGGKDFSIALSGDPKSDARLILSKTRDLLQLRQGAKANPAGRPRAGKKYPSSFIRELNGLLAPYRLLVDGDVDDYAGTNAWAADVSSFERDERGVVIGPHSNGFSLLLMADPPSVEVWANANAGHPTAALRLSGDAKADAKFVFLQVRDLLTRR